MTAVTAPAEQPSTQPNASNALSGDPNQQAAQAANRATEAVQAPTGRTRIVVLPNVPASAGLPPNVAHRAIRRSSCSAVRSRSMIPDSSAVGPQGTSPAAANANRAGRPAATFYVATEAQPSN